MLVQKNNQEIQYTLQKMYMNIWIFLDEATVMQQLKWMVQSNNCIASILQVATFFIQCKERRNRLG